MTIRITNKMAADAAYKMMCNAYDKKMEEIQNEINAEVEALVRKYIPAPVIACVNEYPSYFGYIEEDSITAAKEHTDGSTYLYRESAIWGRLSFKIPTASHNVFVDRKDYSKVRKLYDKNTSLNNERLEFGQKIENALIALRTYKRVEEQLPEAIKYLDIPPTGMLPTPIYKELNELIGQKLNGK